MIKGQVIRLDDKKKDVKCTLLEPEQMANILKSVGLPEQAIQGRIGFEKMIGSKSLNFKTNSIKLITGEEPEPLEDVLKKNYHF